MGKRPGYNWILGGNLPELGRHSVAKHEVFDRYIIAYISTFTRNYPKRALNLPIVDSHLAFLRDEREIVITVADGAIRRSVKRFAWVDCIDLVHEPGLFSLLGYRAA